MYRYVEMFRALCVTSKNISFFLVLNKFDFCLSLIVHMMPKPRIEGQKYRSRQIFRPLGLSELSPNGASMDRRSEKLLAKRRVQCGHNSRIIDEAEPALRDGTQS